MAEQWSRDGYRLTTDPSEIDIGAVHAIVEQSYWAQGIPLAVLQQAVEHSLNFGLLREERLVGFARVITDYATL